MSIKNFSRAYDPTGSAIANRVTNETHLLGMNYPQILTPSLGPFYTDTLTVYSNGVLLTPNLDYQCLALHQPATVATGKSVDLFVKIKNTTIDQVELSYQAIGGIYQDTYPVFKSFIEATGVRLVSPIRWNDILNKPTTFYPAPHFHPYWEITGWEDLINPVAKVLQVTYAKGIPKYKSVYDYMQGKIEGFESKVNASIANFNLLLGVLVNSRVESVGTLKISTMDNNPSNYTDGVWQELDGGILGVGGLSSVGTTTTLSEDIAFPQPDNILLNESSYPVLTDGGDYIYLDNVYPAVYGGDASFDYRVLDEQFNTLGVKGYQKVAKGEDYAVVLTADRDHLTEGDTVTFKLQTYQYDTQVAVPYYISGIGRANINYPVSGMVETDDAGQLTISLKLVAGSPPTDSSSLTLFIGIGAGVSYTLPYELSSNNVKSLTVSSKALIGDVDLNGLTLGDMFYLKLDHTHFAGANVMISAQLDGNGNHGVSVSGVDCQGTNGGVVNVTLPNTTGAIYLPVQTTQRDLTTVSTLTVNVTYGGQVYASTVLPVQMFDYVPEWVDIQANQVVTTVKDNRKFALRIRHNSRQALAFPVSFSKNTVDTSVMTPASIGPILYSGFIQVTQSGSFLINRIDQTQTDHIDTVIYSPMLNTQAITLGLDVSSVVVLRSATITNISVETTRDQTVLVGATNITTKSVSVTD